MRRFLTSVVLAGLTLFAIGCGGGGGGSTPRPPGKIVFTSIGQGQALGQQIYVINPDGTGLNRLTSTPDTFRPKWSRDGARIVYSFTEVQGRELVTMNADSTDQNLIREAGWPSFADWPSWSPDGRKVAFVGDELEIFTANVDGTNLVKLTQDDEFKSSPTWSPDGTKIAFTRDFGANRDEKIFVMNADGSNQVALTTGPGDDREPTWSPNGRSIAFYSNRDGANAIYTMNANGTNVVKVPSPAGQTPQSPDWSPDGRRLVYTTNVSGQPAELWIMNVDGTNPVMISDLPFPATPNWSR